MSSSTVKHTYGSRKRHIPRIPLASPNTSPATSPAKETHLNKRSYSDLIRDEEEDNHVPLFPPSKRTKTLFNKAIFPSSTTATSKPKPKPKPKPETKTSSQKTLTQLHFNIDQSILRTCALCDLSYTKGAQEDEALHRAHCQRVKRDMVWGREEEKDRMRGSDNVVSEVEANIKVKINGKKKMGRIICIPADVGGKLGTKLSAICRIVNTALASPDISSPVLQASKTYLFLLPHESHANQERIVGCVIAQRISTAMAVVSDPPSPPPPPTTNTEADADDTPPNNDAILIDKETGMYCSPTPLPTVMGIPRLYVSPAHRRLGVARALLDAAAATFIHGCPLDPQSGQIAFSQPTGMGQKVMKEWGKGGIRVYEED